MRPVDPSKSRVVLFGVPNYTSEVIDDVGQIDNNVTDLQEILCLEANSVYPEENVIVVPPDAGLASIGATLHAAAAEAEDLFLFYYAGHGLIHPRTGDLHLGLRDTARDHLNFTALPYSSVQDVVSHSQAQNRAVILDCCYSGRAAKQSLSDDMGNVLAQIQIQGSYIIASSPANRTSLVFDNEAHTAFTGRLIRLLEKGVSSCGAWLTFRDIYLQLFLNLNEDGLPLPERVGSATSEYLGLVPNRAWQMGALESPVITAVGLAQVDDSLAEARRYVEEGRTKLSIPVLRRTLMTVSASHGITHPDTHEIRHALALALWRVGQTEEASQILAELQLEQEATHGARAITTLRTRFRLAGLLGDTGDRTAAIEAWRNLVDDFGAAYGPDALETLKCKYWLAGNLAESGKAREAIQLFQQVLTTQLGTLGENHVDTLETASWLSRTMSKHGITATDLSEEFRALLESRRSTLISRQSPAELPSNHSSR